MSSDAVRSIEYETMLLTRHLGSLPGRARRRSGTLDQSAYLLLSLLEAGGEATLAELTAMTGLDVSTLNRQSAALVRKGLALRIADPAGGAARKFRVSRDGSAALREERAASRTAVERITGDWDEADRAALGELLRRFNRGIEEHTSRSVPRPE